MASTTQASSTQPWAASQPMLNQLFSAISPLIGNSGATGAQTGAINQITAMGQAGNPYAAGTTGAVNSLLAGGNATSEIPTVNAAYSTLQNNLSPYTSPSYSTVNSPDVAAALAAANTGISNQVNSEFAAGGRFGSGANQQNLAQGEALADAPIILNQANTDTATRMAAANSLYGAGNTTANTIAGMNQNAATNQNAGINSVGTALNNSVWGPQTTIAAQNLLQSIPAQNIGLLANIGIPLAGLGTNSTGTTNTTSQMSPAAEFAAITQGIGALIPKSNGSAGGLNLNFGGG